MTRAPAARPDAIRRHNLGLLLREIHLNGATTRAELTQRLGLSRSTIGALVADLADLGLLEESVPSGGDRAGRPSHLVAPRSVGPFVVAADIDIAHVTAAAIGVGGKVLARKVILTDSGPNPAGEVARLIMTAFAQLHDEVGAGAWPIGIGVSVPGTVDRYRGEVEFAPNLLWRDEPLGAMLSALAPQSIPVAVGNDADLAVLAEHLRGAGRNCDDLVYLIGRVGVGAGIVTNGRPLRGFDGHAGEVGHNVFDPSGPPCHCGKNGCVETYIGESALLALAGRDPAPTDDNVAGIFADALAGQPTAGAAVREVAGALGRTVAGLVNVLNPQRVILGGSLAEVFGFASAEVASTLHEYAMPTVRDTVQLCAPGLGRDSSLLGAAELAFTDLLADPAGVCTLLAS